MDVLVSEWVGKLLGRCVGWWEGGFRVAGVGGRSVDCGLVLVGGSWWVGV